MNASPQDPNPSPPADDELPGQIKKSPDLKRRRKRRAKLKGWVRKLYDYCVVPADVPTDFNEPLADLIEKLSTGDPAAAAATLAEAEAIFEETRDRIDSAERRATTLQGTVAIAASLAVAGAGLLLDPSKITNGDWRLALVLLLAGFVLCLIGCALRALAVTGRMFEFEQPGPERIHLRAKQTGARAQTFRAAELLRAAGVASEIGAVKVGLLRSSAWWLRRALVVLAVFVITFGVYVATHDNAAAKSMRPTTVTTTHSLRGSGNLSSRPQ